MGSQPPTLRNEIKEALNRHNAENGSDTPDYVLAEFLLAALQAFDTAVAAREVYHGRMRGHEEHGRVAPTH